MSAMHECQIRLVRQLANQIYLLELRAMHAPLPSWYAGQHLCLHLPNGHVAYYSMANCSNPDRLELHLEIKEGSRSGPLVLALAEQQASVGVSLPLGNCHLAQIPPGRLLLVAGQSGFAQAGAMLQHLLAVQHAGPVELLWAASAAYRASSVPLLQAAEQQLKFSSILLAREDSAEQLATDLMRNLRQFALQEGSGTVIVSGSRALLDGVLADAGSCAVYSDLLPNGIQTSRV